MSTRKAVKYRRTQSSRASLLRTIRRLWADNKKLREKYEKLREHHNRTIQGDI